MYENNILAKECEFMLIKTSDAGSKARVDRFFIIPRDPLIFLRIFFSIPEVTRRLLCPSHFTIIP